mmetsp:Transcript_17923/g.30127  ORF Transcript_17923/g.30127 Transcript_17923/m.30127 type:complete len:91 (-) Transcript_17923:528-800(-)
MFTQCSPVHSILPTFTPCPLNVPLLLLQECGIAMSLDEVREMISDADTNKDGLINYEEFSAMMRKGLPMTDDTGNKIGAKKRAGTLRVKT